MNQSAGAVQHSRRYSSDSKVRASRAAPRQLSDAWPGKSAAKSARGASVDFRTSRVPVARLLSRLGFVFAAAGGTVRVAALPNDSCTPGQQM